MALKKISNFEILYNIYQAWVTGASAATWNNTMIDLGYSSSDAVGMIITRAEYHLFDDATNNFKAAFAADADSVAFGLRITGNVTLTPGPQVPGIIDYNTVTADLRGAPASFDLMKDPAVVKDFSWMPDGGLFVHPSSVYTWSYVRNALGASYGMAVKLYYYIRELDDKAYQKLINILSVLRI